MKQNTKAELLKTEIKAIIEPLSGYAAVYKLIVDYLKITPPQIDRSEKVQPLLLLPLLICDALSDQYDRAIPIAASFQFFRAAGDLFDDIEDADSTGSLPSVCGRGIAINIASTLLILGEKALSRLENHGVDANSITHIAEMINSAFLQACIGQHYDLSLTLPEFISEETYFKIAAMKTGSPMECSCRAAALVAGATPEMIDMCASFGKSIGIASQITNDIQGIVTLKDILKPKQTLPIIYALSQSEGSIHDQLVRSFCKSSIEVSDALIVKELLFGIGACAIFCGNARML